MVNVWFVGEQRERMRHQEHVVQPETERQKWKNLQTQNTTKLDEKSSERVQLPAKAFLSPTLATPTISRPASSEFPDGAIL